MQTVETRVFPNIAGFVVSVQATERDMQAARNSFDNLLMK